MGIRVTREEFEKLVEDALHMLPQHFRTALDNVEIIVENEPEETDLAAAEVDEKRSLLGLYTGIPLTERGGWYGMTPVTPDRIQLFQRNLERISKNRKELRYQVLTTVFHELGHYFGMDEEEIRRAMDDYI
jgi:predicted Zn-dependent protease with MMP-like domain